MFWRQRINTPNTKENHMNWHPTTDCIEHPDYTILAWHNMRTHGKTQRSYTEWVNHQLRMSASSASRQWSPGDYWDEHPTYKSAAWVEEVSAGTTRLSYVDWVRARLDETNYPVVCPECGSHEDIEVSGTCLLKVKQEPGVDRWETIIPEFEQLHATVDYHDKSFTTCNACGYGGDLKEFER